MLKRAFHSVVAMQRRWLFQISNINNSPQSQFQIFKTHMQQIENAESLQQAAQLLAKLQSKAETIKQQLEYVQQQIDQYSSSKPHIVEIYNRGKLAQSLIASQSEEAKQIQLRSNRQIENNKIYGISKISKEIIEVSDHLSQAVKMVDGVSPHSFPLLQIQKEFLSMLASYQILQFNPINLPFNPNEQESVGVIESETMQMKNLVGQVKRSGFKIKQRLLRPAYVVIYI